MKQKTGNTRQESESTSRQRNVKQKQENVPNGYGLYVAPETGNTYVIPGV